jgi:hypothetical protein
MSLQQAQRFIAQLSVYLRQQNARGLADTLKITLKTGELNRDLGPIFLSLQYQDTNTICNNNFGNFAPIFLSIILGAIAFYGSDAESGKLYVFLLRSFVFNTISFH